jgi:hypothetical protein
MINNLITMVIQKSYAAPKEAGFSATKCSSNKGFSSKSSIFTRTNFGIFRQESSPQSLTAATLDRCAQLNRRHLTI